MKTFRILVVDNDAQSLMATQAALIGPGRCIITKASGDDVLAFLLHSTVDLCIVDVAMPGMDGFRLVTLIRERPHLAKIPVIFITAFLKSDLDVMRGYDIGASDFIFKPIDIDILRKKVDAWIAVLQHVSPANGKAWAVYLALGAIIALGLACLAAISWGSVC